MSEPDPVLEIRKTTNGSTPWRLFVDGGEWWCRQTVGHPDGAMVLDMPVSGATKKECIDKTLTLLGRYMADTRRRNQAAHAAREAEADQFNA